MAAAHEFSVVDFSVSPPRVTIPRDYNAAVDLIDRRCWPDAATASLCAMSRADIVSIATWRRVPTGQPAPLRTLGWSQTAGALVPPLIRSTFPRSFFGAMKVGAVPVPVSTLLTTADYQFLLSDTRARVLVVSAALYQSCACFRRPGRCRSCATWWWPARRTETVAISACLQLAALLAAAPADTATAATSW